MKPASPPVVVRVPASTSNCGSGFDTLGLALKRYNRVTVTPDAGAVPIADRSADARAQAMVEEAASSFFRTTGYAPAGFRYRIEGDIPSARGLGSSVTVVAGVLAGLDAIHGTSLGRARLVGLVAGIEGHPDNAGASILGGFCVSRSDPGTDAYVDSQRFEVPAEVAFVVVSPPLEFVTKDSRGVLPYTLPFFDAVRSINSAAYVVAAFASRDYARLAQVSRDFMHEPFRLPRIPGAGEAISAGVAAGAWTGWLSGSGSSVLCVCARPRADAVFAAMMAAFGRFSTPNEGRILSADNDGLVIEAASPTPP
jgi:homoserine kinase